MERRMTQALVDADWLLGHLTHPGLRILDASWYLPPNAPDARAVFAEGHIPGARFFDIDAASDPESTLPHMLPTAARFSAFAGALGIGPDTRVVVYDQQGLFSAPRAWWMFRVFGHDAVHVLDGGLPAWREAGGPVESGEPSPALPAPFRARLRALRVRGLGDMLDNLNGGRELVLDARAAARFAGSAPEPRPGMASGHIPGARSVPYADMLANGRMKAPEDLRARFAAAGADGARPIVTSCGSGMTAAVLTLGLAVAGLPEGALYDGSWSEWGSIPETPKATGLD
jgi:thiosulfate/3-mercaptopyruvate sulfurtransferase